MDKPPVNVDLAVVVEGIVVEEENEDLLNCSLCFSEAQYTGRNILLTKSLLNQFVSATERSLFRPLKLFDFCVHCAETVEDLRILQNKFDKVKHKLKVKKTELKYRILKGNREVEEEDEEDDDEKVFETFRNICTRDFCPQVQIDKNNKLYKGKYIQGKNEQSISKVVPQSPWVETKIYFKNRKRACPKSRGKTKAAGVANPKDKIKLKKISKKQKPNPNSLGENTVKIEDLVEIELVGVDGCEIGNWWSGSQIEENGRPNDKSWDRPRLSYLELSLFAIFTSEKFQMSVRDIFKFVEDIFPYYKLNKSRISWRENIRLLVKNCKYITTSSSAVDDPIKGNFTCALKYSKTLLEHRKRIRCKLKLLTYYMSSPKWIPTFQNSLLRKIPKNSTITMKNKIKSASMTKNFPRYKTLENTWWKPPFTLLQLCVLAIMTTENMQMSIGGIIFFISKMFPYYKDVTKWETNLKGFIGKSSFITTLNVNPNSACIYTIKSCVEYYAIRKLFIDELIYHKVVDYMAFPEMIAAFRETLLREVPQIPILPACSSSNTDNNSPDSHDANYVTNYNDGVDIKPSDRPRLSYVELCLFALMSSKNMKMKIEDIYHFIEDNFPYYKLNILGIDWRENIRLVVRQCKYIRTIYTTMLDGPSISNFTCSVKNSKLLLEKKRRIYSKLAFLADFMSHPDRMPEFQKSLGRKIPRQPFKRSKSPKFKIRCRKDIFTAENEILIDEVEPPTLWREPPPCKIKDNVLRKQLMKPKKCRNLPESKTDKVSSQINKIAKNVVGDHLKIWKSPTLSIAQISVLAIIYAENIPTGITEIYDFIITNFPFFKEYSSSCKKAIHDSLLEYSFIRSSGHFLEDSSDSLTYTIEADSGGNFYYIRHLIFNELSGIRIADCMAFPDRIPLFREALLRELPQRLEISATNAIVNIDVPIDINCSDNETMESDEAETIKIENAWSLGDCDNLSQGSLQDMPSQFTKNQPETSNSIANNIGEMNSTSAMEERVADEANVPTSENDGYDSDTDIQIVYEKNEASLNNITYSYMISEPSDIPPPLQVKEWALLAILVSENMEITIKDIYDFIEDNLTKKIPKDTSWKEKVTSFLQKCEYITTSFKNLANNIVVTVRARYCEDFNEARNSVIHKLKYMTNYMEHPERIPSFQKSLFRRLPDETGKRNIKMYCISKHKKNWKKPPLSLSQLSVLAIMTSEKMEANLNEINTFIKSQFPCYKNYCSLDKSIVSCLQEYSFIVPPCHREQSITVKYAVKRCTEFYKIRSLICDALTSGLISDCMAFPELNEFFIKALQRTSQHASETANSASSSKSTPNIEIEISDDEDDETVKTVESDDDVIEIVDHLKQTPTDDRIIKLRKQDYVGIGMQPRSSSLQVPTSSIVNDNNNANRAVNQIIEMNPQLSIIPINTNSNISEALPMPYWPKPVLTLSQLCVLSILNSGKMMLKIEEFHSFITDNFPYYALQMSCPPSYSLIELALQNPLFSSRSKSSVKLYAIRDTQMTPERRLEIVTILHCKENIASMKFSQRLKEFVSNVATGKVFPVQ